MKKQAGISVSEVLVSLFLSSLIVTLLVQFYCKSKDNYLKAETVLAQELDLNWVSELFSDSIRRAGFTPCLALGQLIVLDTRDNAHPIQALNIKSSSPQMIHINRMSEYFSKVLHIQNSKYLIVSSESSFHANRSVLVADCDHAEVHQIDTVVKHPEGILITLKKPLQFQYPLLGYVGEFIEERWFINKNTEGNSSLYYQSAQAEELSTLVNSLEIHPKPVADKLLIEVIMGLTNGSFRKISVLVRGS